MEQDIKVSRSAQHMANLGVILWIALTIYFELYAITAVICIFAVPASIITSLKYYWGITIFPFLRLK